MRLRRRTLVDRLAQRLTEPRDGDLVDELAGTCARDDIEQACAMWAAADSALVGEPVPRGLRHDQ